MERGLKGMVSQQHKHPRTNGTMMLMFAPSRLLGTEREGQRRSRAKLAWVLKPGTEYNDKEASTPADTSTGPFLATPTPPTPSSALPSRLWSWIVKAFTSCVCSRRILPMVHSQPCRVRVLIRRDPVSPSPSPSPSPSLPSSISVESTVACRLSRDTTWGKVR